MKLAKETAKDLLVEQMVGSWNTLAGWLGGLRALCPPSAGAQNSMGRHPRLG